MTEAVRDLLRRALELPASERAQVFDELFESLAGHDELDALVDELELRGDLAWDPDIAEIERVRAASEAKPGVRWPTADDVLDDLSRHLAHVRAARLETGLSSRELRLTGKAGDLAGAALALSPSERGALAHEILETIERSDTPDDPDEGTSPTRQTLDLPS